MLEVTDQQLEPVEEAEGRWLGTQELKVELLNKGHSGDIITVVNSTTGKGRMAPWWRVQESALRRAERL